MWHGFSYKRICVLRGLACRDERAPQPTNRRRIDAVGLSHVDQALAISEPLKRFLTAETRCIGLYALYPPKRGRRQGRFFFQLAGAWSP